MNKRFIQTVIWIETSLSATTDEELEAVNEVSEDIMDEIEDLILTLYQEGGQRYRPGYTVYSDL